jgi:hypothetical protein
MTAYIIINSGDYYKGTHPENQWISVNYQLVIESKKVIGAW